MAISTSTGYWASRYCSFLPLFVCYPSFGIFSHSHLARGLRDARARRKGPSIPRHGVHRLLRIPAGLLEVTLLPGLLGHLIVPRMLLLLFVIGRGTRVVVDDGFRDFGYLRARSGW